MTMNKHNLKRLRNLPPLDFPEDLFPEDLDIWLDMQDNAEIRRLAREPLEADRMRRRRARRTAAGWTLASLALLTILLIVRSCGGGS